MESNFVVDKYDVIVIGAGHAGIEAALAAARRGCKTLLTTLSLENLAMMPCNPSIGGPAKGHLVRELDALGGEMGIAADQTCIQFRTLNTGKGVAVQALRAQADKKIYQAYMKNICENTANLDVKQILVEELLIEDSQVVGVRGEQGETFLTKTAILAAGTYLNGAIIIGENSYAGGPNGQRAAVKLTDSLLKNNIELRRFKTGTPARVDGRTLDFSKMQVQHGDASPLRFSFLTAEPVLNKVDCYLTYTNERTHEIIKKNLHRAPMANGLIKGVGPRYCPSIESKIITFPDKERHQLFIEPEGLNTQEFYVQGMSTSLPADVQIEFLRTIAGLENVQIMRYGYAIEYDCINPLQLKPTLELKNISGLFSAGQTNGTSGYEEAAAQGLIAGINAAAFVKQESALILKRSESYIGVLIDDLVTKGTNEPYRMMTSRAEYRLLLRQDNADLRLTPYAIQLGLATPERKKIFQRKQSQIQLATKKLQEIKITPNNQLNDSLENLKIGAINNTMQLAELLRRPNVKYKTLQKIFDLPEIDDDSVAQVEIDLFYSGYIEKQAELVEKFDRLESQILPLDIDYSEIKNLSLEAREKLAKIQPHSLGQASRISGVNPADISVLMIWLNQHK